MATESYPTGLPDVLLAGLVRRGVSPVRGQQPVKGAPVLIKWTDDQADVWSVTWRLSPIQKRAFDGWVYNNLNNAVEWFNIALPVSVDAKGDLRIHEANFGGNIPSGVPRGGFVIVTVELTVRDVYRDPA